MRRCSAESPPDRNATRNFSRSVCWASATFVSQASSHHVPVHQGAAVATGRQQPVRMDGHQGMDGHQESL
jgi:hypothetical protein